MDSIKNKWDLIKETLREEYELTDISYNTWIVPLNFYQVKDNVVMIIIPSDQAHALNYISSKYKSFFQVTISEMMNHTYDIAFILEKDVVEGALKEDDPLYNLKYEHANLNPKYKFDTFVVGSNNKFAHSASLAVAESPGDVYNPLYIYGGAGLGKTHLMHSIGRYILEQNPDMKVLYVTSEVFTNEVIDGVRSGDTVKMNKFREKYRTVDVLLIDDIQFIIGKFTDDKLNIINQKYVHSPVFLAEFVHFDGITASNAVDDFIGKDFRRHIEHFHIRILF